MSDAVIMDWTYYKHRIKFPDQPVRFWSMSNKAYNVFVQEVIDWCNEQCDGWCFLRHNHGYYTPGVEMCFKHECDYLMCKLKFGFV